MYTLTGNTRYRVGFRGKLILQVEERFYKSRDPQWGDFTIIEDTRWRDAKALDIINGELKLDD